jgi:hypothetical protein
MVAGYPLPVATFQQFRFLFKVLRIVSERVLRALVICSISINPPISAIFGQLNLTQSLLQISHQSTQPDLLSFSRSRHVLILLILRCLLSVLILCHLRLSLSVEEDCLILRRISHVSSAL